MKHSRPLSAPVGPPCLRRCLDPFAYLRDVLTRLPNMTNRQIPEVTPQAWSKTRQSVQRQAAS